MARKRRRGRPVNGILLLNKPLGLSSNTALQRAKWLYGAAKAGHTGNLDPLATGMLPLCFGEATKISAFLLDSDKRYQASCRLGVTTSTGDGEGEVLTEQTPPALQAADLKALLAERFVGEQEQVPPMYSALKHNGQPLYKLARRGQVVERAPRKITIHALRLLSYTENTLEIEVHCSKGTYIRTLIEDIGAALGCGAYMTALHRTAAAPFGMALQGEAAAMLSLDELEQLAAAGPAALDAKLLKPETALHDWPKLILSAELSGHIQRGQSVAVANAPSSGLFRLYADMDEGQRFIGIGQMLDDGRVGPKRLIFY